MNRPATGHARLRTLTIGAMYDASTTLVSQRTIPFFKKRLA
jgi:hypothetical protein